ncbi:MAG: hypothetical protein KAJ18_11680 [Candidatus Omnitrophica bacterium]|nr:hypothetical protein [Candidatus Omnitrophota bacterium]
MNLFQMRDVVEDIISNSDYDPTRINAFINEGVQAVATGVILPGRFDLSPPLPDLYTTDTVDTDANSFVSLPADFNRDVVIVKDSNSNKIPIISSFQNFLHLYKEETGSVDKCSINGSILHYRGIPSSPETLTVNYYSTPATLIADDDIPTDIPLVLHRQLIVGYALKEIYNEIELGMEGRKVDMKNYEEIFNQGLVRLRQLIPEDSLPDFYEENQNDINRNQRI